MTIEHSPFAPPTLGAVPAAPPSGVPMLPDSAPTLASETAAPALPSLPRSAALAPTAPPATSAPAAPTTALTVDVQATPVPPTAPTPTMAPTTSPARKRSRSPFIVVAGLAIATIAGATWFTLSTADDSADDTAPAEAPAGLDIAPQEVSNPLVVPIDDASEVMVEIDDNSTEAEALELLGLDEEGNPVSDDVADGAAAAESIAGHRFTWSDGTDSSVNITVDATTGNYRVESTDGTERRYVDSTSYSRRGDIAWTQTDGDAFASVRRMGFDGPMLIAEVLDPVTVGYTTSPPDELDDGTTVITAEVDAFAYSQSHPNEYAAFMTSLGHPVGTEAVQPGDIVIVQAELGADGGTIEMMTVETATFTTSYVLDEVFDTAPVIETPPV